MPSAARPSQASSGQAERDTSASPSPRPTSLSPGIRASALQKLYNDALTHTLRACSYSNFASCFPTPAKYVPESLDGLHREFVGKLEQQCKVEFESLLEVRDVVPSLNELDNLIADAKKRQERAGQTSQIATPTPPHLLPPSALLAAHMVPFLATQTKSLGEQLETTQKSNHELADAIASQRDTMESLVNGLETFIRDLEGAAALFGGVELKNMEADLERAATAS